MESGRPIFIPVILGTTRKGRMSEHVANFMTREVARQENVETALIDIRNIPLPTDDAGEHIKDAGFSETAMKADAFVIVAPNTTTAIRGS
jgi:NAD(P)H-dependent FMN reductase